MLPFVCQLLELYSYVNLELLFLAKLYRPLLPFFRNQLVVLMVVEVVSEVEVVAGKFQGEIRIERWQY